MEAIIFSRDPKLISTLQSVCAKLSINTRVCSDASGAELIAKRKIYAVLLDDADLAGGRAFLSAVRQSSSSRQAVCLLFGRLASGAPIDAAIIVPKPVSVEMTVRALRAARGVMNNEFRRYVRYPLSIPLTVTTGNRELSATVLNISDEGLAVQFAPTDMVAPRTALQIRLVLPPAQAVVQLSGELVWFDASARAGITFRGAARADKEKIQRWLDTQLPPPVNVA